jgi:hypothetical protein
MYYIEGPSHDPMFNLAMEEYLYRSVEPGDPGYFLLWQNEPSIIVGRFQNTAQEVNRAFAEEHRIHIVRRISGGGAVYHDLGNLNYTFIVPNDEGNPFDFARHALPIVNALEKLDWQDLGPNLAYLVPYGNIRMCTVGLENRPASQNEIGFMCDLLEEGISNGAVGLSTGLIYPPCNYASEEEISEVTKVLAKYGLPFVIHQRSEADDILNSMDEVIRISKKSGCHIHFSHFKIAGKKNASLFESVMRKLDTASREISLSFDQYPYTAGSTTFSVILPPWVHFGGVEKAVIRLSDVAQREKMKKDILNGIPGWDNFIDFAGMENICVTFVKTEKTRILLGKICLKLENYDIKIL